MSKKEWFSAKGIFLHEPWAWARNMKQWYEERIVLLKAKSEKEAWKRAKKEAKEYVKDLDGTHFIEITEVCTLYEDKIGDKIEVFSTKNISLLQPDEYLETFYPTTPKDCEANGEQHSWHNLDNKYSACYNCLVKRKGQLWKTKDEQN